MFEKFGWKQAKKSPSAPSQSRNKRKKKVKTPPPGFSVLMGQRRLPKGDNQVKKTEMTLDGALCSLTPGGAPLLKSK